MLLTIHVRPNASKTGVGGAHDGALVVRVAEPPDGGRATAAALRAVAVALDVPGRSVRLVRGATSRRKLIEIAVEDSVGSVMEERVVGLLGPTGL